MAKNRGRGENLLIGGREVLKLVLLAMAVCWSTRARLILRWGRWLELETMVVLMIATYFVAVDS